MENNAFQSLLKQQQQSAETPAKGGELGYLPVVAGVHLQSTQGLLSDSKGVVPAGTMMLKYSSAPPGKEGNAIQRALLKAHDQVKEKASDSSGSGGGSSGGGGSGSSAPVSTSSGGSSAPVSSGGGGGGGGGAPAARGGSSDTGLASAVAALQGIGGLAPMEISAPVQMHHEFTPIPIAPVVAPPAMQEGLLLG
jgi:hypothetical protein